MNAAGFDIKAPINVRLVPKSAQIGERWLAKALKLGKSLAEFAPMAPGLPVAAIAE